MEVLTLDEVYYSHRGTLVRAIVKLAGSGIGIKAQTLSEIQTIKLEEIKECVEHYGVVAHGVRITKKDGTAHIIDGISADALENIKQYTKKHYKMAVYNRQLAVDGNVQGRLEVLDAYVEMKVGDKTRFEIPLSAISNAYERRGEGIIDIHESYYGTTEIRFGSLQPESNVWQLIEQIKGATGRGDQMEVLAIEEVLCVLPRGKLKLMLTSASLHLIGKTYSHQIPFETMSRLFFLERNSEEGEEDLVYLILELKTPIRQGQTRYYFVSILLPTEPVTITLGKNSVVEYDDESFSAASHDELVGKLSGGSKREVDAAPELEPEEAEGAEAGREKQQKLAELGLSLQYSDKLANCLLQVLQQLAKLAAIQTGTFITSTGNKSLKCSSKANEGYLYLLKNGFLFIPKIAYIEYCDIRVVEFSRVNLSTRTAKTFDVRIIMKDKKEHMFNGIQKVDFSAFENYLGAKQVDCRSEVGEEAYRTDHHSEDDSEEETVSEPTSDEESASEYESGSSTDNRQEQESDE